MARVTLITLDAKLEYIARLVEKTDHTVHGNGKDGLVTKVDRLEQTESTRKWTIKALVGSVLVGGVTFLFKLIGG